MVQTKWVARKISADVVTQHVADGLHPILARVLAGRGVETSDEALRFLNPSLKDFRDPSGLKDMDVATHRITEAVISGETIGIFGDYDVDGVTSTSVLSSFLNSVGAKCVQTIPSRLKEGYGLGRPGLERLKALGAKLIITVDCGVTAVEEVDYATSQGLEVIIVDHHTVPVTLPRAVALINPHRSDCDFGGEHFCAVAVVFHLCMALRRELRKRGFFKTIPEPDLASLLDMVAVGTVADVMPLIKENRAIVLHGLKMLRANKRPGLRALLDVAGVDPQKAGVGTLGFQIGPRINAAGRLENAMLAVDLLLTENDEDARELAKELDDQNVERRSLEKAIVQEAIKEIESSQIYADAFVNVVGNETWHPGVVGIVASRLVDKFGKPAIVIGENGKGSGRSIPAFHLHEALTAVKEHMIGFGGHAHAVGVHIDHLKLSAFFEALNSHAKSVLKKEDLVKTLYHDGSILLDDVNEKLICELEKAEPYGRGNPAPVFYLEQVPLRNIQALKEVHLRAETDTPQKIRLIGFGLFEKVDTAKTHFDLLATLEINEWRGTKNLQLNLKDIR